MSYASSIVTLKEAPSPATAEARDYLQALAEIRGSDPVAIVVRSPAGSVAAQSLAKYPAGAHLIASGELALDQPDGNVPILTALVVCPAADDQYLNEVVIVGRVGTEAKEAESGKSTRRNVAVNRYFREPGAEEPTELTDWYAIRAYGFVKERLEKAAIGALVEIGGTLVQMKSSKGDPYCEVKARLVRVHRGTRAAADPAAGTSAVGYDHDSFRGQPDDMPSAW